MQLELVGVQLVHFLAAGEGVVRVRARGRLNLPGQQPRRDRPGEAQTARERASKGLAAAAAHMTVSSAPLTNWPAAAGKASIESYGAPTSSAKARRFIMRSLQSRRLGFPFVVRPVAKNFVLQPAT